MTRRPVQAGFLHLSYHTPHENQVVGSREIGCASSSAVHSIAGSYFHNYLSLFFQIESFLEENSVCFNNAPTVLKYLTSFFLFFFSPSKDDYAIRTENVKTASQGKQSSQGPSLSAVLYEYEYSAEIFRCYYLQRSLRLDLMKNQPPWVGIRRSAPTLVLLQNHSNHRR